MKKTTLIVALALIASIGYTQSKSVESFKNKYADDRDATVVTLQGNIFRLIGSIAEYSDDEDAQALSKMADGIKSMQIISLPKYETGLEDDEIKQLKSNLMKESYEELMNFREGREKVVIYSQGNEDEVRNMLILVEERNEFAVINIDGILKMKDLAYIASHHDKWD
jgi:hypothetical protein